MKINWKVRLKNKLFWVTFIPMTIAFLYMLLSVFGITPKISENNLVNVLLTFISSLAELGILVDPTTPGTSDSERALSYDAPGQVKGGAEDES
jgi:phi LC3 family holin